MTASYSRAAALTSAARQRNSLPALANPRPRRTVRDARRPVAPAGRPGPAPARGPGSTRRSPCPPPHPCPASCRSRPRCPRCRAGRRRSGRRGQGRGHRPTGHRAADRSALPRIAPAVQEKEISAPVFSRCRRVMAPIDRSGRVSASRSSIWPPTMPCAPAALARSPTRWARTDGIAVRVLVRQHLEGQRLQRVAGQDGGGLVELLVTGGLAAPEIVVVHGRQVVVDQRIGVQEFDGAGGPQRRQRGDLEQRCAGQHEKRRAGACRRPGSNSASPRRRALRRCLPSAEGDPWCVRSTRRQTPARPRSRGAATVAWVAD